MLSFAQTKLGELAFANGQIDGFSLNAPQIDPRYAFDQAQLLAQSFGKALEIGIGVAVAHQGKLEAEYIAEVIVDRRAPGARRQVILDFPDLAPHLVPDLRQLGRAVSRQDLYLNIREACTRERLHIFQLLELLQRRLDPIGDLELDLPRPGAGIRGDDHRVLDGEFRILQLAKREVAGQAREDDEKGREIGDFLFFDGDRRNAHSASPSSGSLTRWPSFRNRHGNRRAGC